MTIYQYLYVGAIISIYYLFMQGRLQGRMRKLNPGSIDLAWNGVNELCLIALWPMRLANSFGRWIVRNEDRVYVFEALNIPYDGKS